MDNVIILTCNRKGRRAAKKFIKQSDGSIEKISYKAGMFFKCEERQVSSLQDLIHIIQSISNDPRKFLIRGQAKENIPDVVRRKTNNPDAAFDDVARSYIMLDIDKVPYLNHFSVIENPEEVVKWVIARLPDIFHKSKCYYKFSSSQNVPAKLNEPIKKEVSVHLWFWCSRPVTNQEWKQFFKDNPAPVDTTLFSAVQPHFTANPIFGNMNDPLSIRDGILDGKSDYVTVPAIQIEEPKLFNRPNQEEPEVSQDDREKAIALLLPHYNEGVRNTLCGGIAATLYRGGWQAENAADFVYQLANTGNDTEAIERQKNALRICDAVDNGRPAQGIPTLKDDVGIESLDVILSLLGVGKPDSAKIISTLRPTSSFDDIKATFSKLLNLSPAEIEICLDEAQSITKKSKKALREILKEAEEESASSPLDLSDTLMERLLLKEYEGGQTLLVSADKSYWAYNGRYWEIIPDLEIKKEMLTYARELITERESRREAASLIKSAMEVLQVKGYQKNDPLRQTKADIPLVINCKNCELWFDKNGGTIAKPHKAESFLRYHVDVEYDPNATCPKFDNAISEVFSTSSAPEDMIRHFLEIAAYICQPWRKIAAIFLFIGAGSNGKTSLMQLVQRMLSDSMVMADRIDSIAGKEFKLGALDGKLLFLDDDVDERTIIPDGTLKKLSQDELLTGQHKYQNLFQFKCRAVPVMLSNHYPAMTDLTKGMRRRLHVVPFTRSFEKYEIKPDLFDEIWREEASGILNQIIAAFQRLKKRGRFKEPKDCKVAKKTWIDKSNSLPAFINEVCIEGANEKQLLKTFYEDYRDYCFACGSRSIRRDKVESRLEALGFAVHVGGGRQKYVIGLRTMERGDIEQLSIDLRQD